MASDLREAAADVEPWQLVLGLLWYGAFILAIVLHEGAHALVAYKLGDSTAYRGGQVTLDPRPHMRREPVGTIIVPIVSYLLAGFMMGWAHAPYDPYWADRYPRRKALMALAGPIANLLLAVLTGLLLYIGLKTGYFVRASEFGIASIADGTDAFLSDGTATLLSILFVLNLILFILNMFPLPPFDGSSVVTLLFSPDVARKIEAFRHDRMFSLLGMIVAWRLFGEGCGPILVWCAGVLHS